MRGDTQSVSHAPRSHRGSDNTRASASTSRNRSGGSQKVNEKQEEVNEVEIEHERTRQWLKLVKLLFGCFWLSRAVTY